MEIWQFVFGLVTLLVAIITATLRVQKLFRDEMRAEFALMKIDLETKAREVGESTDLKLHRQNVHYQDTFTALREKIKDVELWVRDHCVLSGPFESIIDGLRGDILRNRQETSERLDKLDGKIDQLLQRPLG